MSDALIQPGDPVVRVGSARNLITLHNVARAMRVLERDVEALLATIEQVSVERGYCAAGTTAMVPIVEVGGRRWIDLHALEHALGLLMDPQTDPADWETISEVYKRHRKADLERRLYEAAKGIFQPLRKTVQDRSRARNYYNRVRRKPRRSAATTDGDSTVTG